MIKRRLILQIAGLTCAASPFRFVLANTAVATDLRLLVVRDGLALPLFSAGDLLVADARQTRYMGEGIYLYPHWGAPRPYLVSLVADAGKGKMLEFRNPGDQNLLWSQSPALDGQFAGKVVEHISRLQAISKTGNYPLLRVPAAPASTEVPGIVGNISGRM
jgi:hypothetical protein